MDNQSGHTYTDFTTTGSGTQVGDREDSSVSRHDSPDSLTSSFNLNGAYSSLHRSNSHDFNSSNVPFSTTHHHHYYSSPTLSAAASPPTVTAPASSSQGIFFHHWVPPNQSWPSVPNDQRPIQQSPSVSPLSASPPLGASPPGHRRPTQRSRSASPASVSPTSDPVPSSAERDRRERPSHAREAALRKARARREASRAASKEPFGAIESLEAQISLLKAEKKGLERRLTEENEGLSQQILRLQKEVAECKEDRDFYRRERDEFAGAAERKLESPRPQSPRAKREWQQTLMRWNRKPIGMPRTFTETTSGLSDDGAITNGCISSTGCFRSSD